MGMGSFADGARAPVAAAGPAPGGRSLSTLVECRTSRSSVRGEPHRVSIAPDWSVQTPHDLDAERVGVAFGGYASCL